MICFSGVSIRTQSARKRRISLPTCGRDCASIHSSGSGGTLFLGRELHCRHSALPNGAPPAANTHETVNETDAKTSLAILPFRLLGNQSSTNAFLAPGITETLITKLSRIERLSVPPPSAILRYAEGVEAVRSQRAARPVRPRGLLILLRRKCTRQRAIGLRRSGHRRVGLARLKPQKTRFRKWSILLRSR